MPVKAICTNKSSGKQNEPFMDQKKNKVYCSICYSEMVVNHFIKSQLQALKQYGEKKVESFSVKCTNCSQEGRPILNKNKQVFCQFCKKELENLSEAFKLMLQNYLEKADKEL